MPNTNQVRVMRRSLLWRLHFWAALIASPFVFLACLTGILYVCTPQIEAVLYGGLDVVEVSTQRKVLDDSVAAARRAMPAGFVLHSVLPAPGDRDSVRVVFVPAIPRESVGRSPASGEAIGDHAGHAARSDATTASGSASPRGQFLRPNFGVPERASVVYVNPYTAEVLGVLPEARRFTNWARRLHSSLLQGENWRWMIELAASWMMVMLATGAVLWWPRQGQSGLPTRGTTGRLAWRQWHAFLGVALSLLTLTMLATGLTWSRTAGSQVRWVRDVAGQTPPRIPAHFKSVVPDDGRMLGWEQAFQAIRRNAPDAAMQIMAPTGRDGFWRANHLEKKGNRRRGSIC